MAQISTQPKTFKSYAGNIVREYKSNIARDIVANEIPIISMKSPREEILETLKYASVNVGFFYLQDHGISEDTSDELVATAKKFFALPDDIKAKYDCRNTKHVRGYEGFNLNHVDKDLDPDINEQFNWGYSPDLELDYCNGEHTTTEITWSKDNPMCGENTWVDEVDLKPKVRAYYGQVLQLARKLATYFAMVLELPEDYFTEALKQPGSIGKVIRYPPQSPSANANAIGIGAHTDIECFTILKTDDVPALQILNKHGEWLNAPPLKNTFVVNIGDMLARWTNDLFLSTIHRVINLTGKERYSIPVFIGPSYDTVVEPLEKFNKNGESRYKPVVAGEYVIARLRRDILDQDE